jgi:hypothetical protein
VGVIASSTASGANTDVYWFDEVHFASDTLAGVRNQSRSRVVLDYNPSVMKMDLSSGSPASFITNDKSLYTAEYATTTPVYSPNGFIYPGVGDLVLRVYAQQGNSTTTVSTLGRVK